jgi:hypothetical protein
MRRFARVAEDPDRERGQPDPRYLFLLERRNCSSQSPPGRVPNSFPKRSFSLPEKSLRSDLRDFRSGKKMGQVRLSYTGTIWCLRSGKNLLRDLAAKTARRLSGLRL